MAIRFAAASGLALAALLVASAAHAQSYYSYYDISPRQIVGMLADQGYDLRGPMMRRGDAYIVDVVSVSGRSLRLIVDARDGRVMQSFAERPRFADDGARFAPGPRDDAEDADRPAPRQFALGDLFNPPTRVYGGDSLFGSRPTPPATVPDADPLKPPKRHVVRKHKDPALANAPATTEPDAAASAGAAQPPADATPSVAAVAPNGAPEPKKSEPAKPAPPIEQAKPETPKPVAAPAPKAADAATPAAADMAPKPAAPRKKLNDLPVGTLD